MENTLTNVLLLTGSTFVLVFALGMQSLNVNGGHYKAAAITSFFIGAGQMVLYKLAPSANWIEITAYLLGGPAGITASMFSHKHIIRWTWKKESSLVSGDNVISLVARLQARVDELEEKSMRESISNTMIAKQNA